MDARVHASGQNSTTPHISGISLLILGRCTVRVLTNLLTGFAVGEMYRSAVNGDTAVLAR